MTDNQMADLTAHVVRLRRDILAKERSGWTRQEWVDDARAIMDDLHGSVACLLNGHVLALFSLASDVEDQVAASYAEGYEAGRADFRVTAIHAIDELMDYPR